MSPSTLHLPFCAEQQVYLWHPPFAATTKLLLWTKINETKSRSAPEHFGQRVHCPPRLLEFHSFITALSFIGPNGRLLWSSFLSHLSSPQCAEAFHGQMSLSSTLWTLRLCLISDQLHCASSSSLNAPSPSQSQYKLGWPSGFTSGTWWFQNTLGLDRGIVIFLCSLKTITFLSFCKTSALWWSYYLVVTSLCPSSDLLFIISWTSSPPTDNFGIWWMDYFSITILSLPDLCPLQIITYNVLEVCFSYPKILNNLIDSVTTDFAITGFECKMWQFIFLLINFHILLINQTILF